MASQLVELRSRKAARILDAARELVLDHGASRVAVSDISRAAGVGKGTVYLYWPSKEDLIRGLFARDLLTLIDTMISHITADPAAVLPSRMAVLVVRTAQRLPLARRLHDGDADLLRVLMLDPADRALYARTRPAAMAGAATPILRRHGLVRDDKPLPGQAYAMHAVIAGFIAALSDPAPAPPGVDDPEAVLADTLATLLDPPRPPRRPAIAAAATEILAVLDDIRTAVVDLIDRSQNTPH